MWTVAEEVAVCTALRTVHPEQFSKSHTAHNLEKVDLLEKNPQLLNSLEAKISEWKPKLEYSDSDLLLWEAGPAPVSSVVSATLQLSTETRAISLTNHFLVLFVVSLEKELQTFLQENVTGNADLQREKFCKISFTALQKWLLHYNYLHVNFLLHFQRTIPPCCPTNYPHFMGKEGKTG